MIFVLQSAAARKVFKYVKMESYRAAAEKVCLAIHCDNDANI